MRGGKPQRSCSGFISLFIFALQNPSRMPGLGIIGFAKGQAKLVFLKKQLPKGVAI